MFEGTCGAARPRRALGLALAAFATILSTGPALANVKDGVDAWSAGNYTGAVAQWRPLADQGDPDALFNLAQAYKLGRGVPKDLSRATQLYGEAAAKGHVQAADNYGLLLFRDGERERAMPYIEASAERGDARAQYILGVAHFNGDLVAKDWVRAYALVSLAQQAGLPQATAALAQMDSYIPLEQRQQSVVVSKQLAARAAANRERLATSTELAPPGTLPANATTPQAQTPSRAHYSPPSVNVADEGEDEADALVLAARTAHGSSPATAGADFARPAAKTATVTPRVTPRESAKAPVKSASSARATRAPAPLPTPAPASSPPPREPQVASGPWQLQLGAFGVAGNADKLWQKVKDRPEMRGHKKHTEKAGRLVKLFATGYASRSDASSACSRLKAGGFDCIVVHD